jgi:REP element-mobilizing transposase RayT
MDDHVHVMVRPFAAFALERIVPSWKSFSAHVLRQRGRGSHVWAREYYDRIIRNRADFDEKLGYICTNPQRRWPGVVGYPWVWHDPNAG